MRPTRSMVATTGGRAGDRRHPGSAASGGRRALARVFVVMSTDSGHSVAEPAKRRSGSPPGGLGLDPEARRHYGDSADITLAPIAKAIIVGHYGRKADYSYMPLLERRRHTMVAATRMPEAYDGLLAGDPGSTCRAR